MYESYSKIQKTRSLEQCDISSKVTNKNTKPIFIISLYINFSAFLGKGKVKFHSLLLYFLKKLF